MNILTCIAFAILCLPLTAIAQSTDQNSKQFHEFYAPFLTGEWNYRTHMTDEAGATVYEGTDVRRYELGVRDRFVIENIYAEEDGSLMHTGIQMIGFDAKVGTVHISAFWPWQATLIGDVTGQLKTQSDGNPGISGIARPAGQAFPELRFDCSFVPADEFRCSTITTNAEGKSFKSNEEVFSRRN